MVSASGAMHTQPPAQPGHSCPRPGSGDRASHGRQTGQTGNRQETDRQETVSTSQETGERPCQPAQKIIDYYLPMSLYQCPDRDTQRFSHPALYTHHTSSRKPSSSEQVLHGTCSCLCPSTWVHSLRCVSLGSCRVPSEQITSQVRESTTV